MPPKRKDSATTPGPKQKRSKTSFRTPTAAASGSESGQAVPSEVGSTKNRVVTLRASASGCRGYRSQDLSTGPSSSLETSTASPAENSILPSEISNSCEPISTPNLESDTQPGPNSSVKLRPKQKNTTTVR